jgi:RNA polymerase sigma-70 factor (ECF subfamily)
MMIPGALAVEEPETDIVRRAMQGEDPAFSQLFHRYSRPLQSFLYGMAGRRESAEDLMQETVSRAFRLLPTLRDESKFSSWLFGIARNVALETCRRHPRNLKQVGLDHQEVQKLSDPGMSPETDAMKQQLYRAVNTGLSLLDEESRTVLALRVFAEKKYQEIAEITGWSLPKVKVEIHRARLKMRKIVEPHLGSQEMNHAL